MASPTLSRTERFPFSWHCFDLNPELPPKWTDEILAIVKSAAKRKVIRPHSVTSRELPDVLELHTVTVGGVIIKERLPWLDELYRGRILELGRSLLATEVAVAIDQRYALNLNCQFGTTGRYECHVDSNPLEGLLYVTTHSPGAGGELVVSNRGDVHGIEEVLTDATRIYPISGQLVFFDARRHSHFVSPLKDPDGLRVVVAMNFYTPDCSEADRPADLNRHLGLE